MVKIIAGTRRSLAIVAGSLCLGLVATAQATDTNREQQARHSGNGSAGLVFSRSIIGQPVRNSEGQEIGHVDELILNTDGRVRYGIVSVGKGFLGIGNKRVAIPWQDMALSATQQGYELDVSKEALAQTPAYSESQ